MINDASGEGDPRSCPMPNTEHRANPSNGTSSEPTGGGDGHIVLMHRKYLSPTARVATCGMAAW